MLNLCKIIFLSCLFFLEYNKYYASSKYGDSVFSICHLRLKERLLAKSSPNKINVKSYIEKGLKRGSFEGLRNQEYDYVDMFVATAFYLGDGRFVTNFHLVLSTDPSKNDGYTAIKYKDKIIHLDEGIQYDSISDLLVFHSTSTDLKDLVPLEIGSLKEGLSGGEIAAFDYDYEQNVDLQISPNQAKDFDRGTAEVDVKGGMSGSPLLCQKKVIGIVNAYCSRIKITHFASSLHLLALLKSSKISCNLGKCINDGLDHLMDEAKNGDEHAKKTLLIFLNQEYVKKKYFKYYWKDKMLHIFKYTWEIFKKLPKDFL